MKLTYDCTTEVIELVGSMIKGGERGFVSPTAIGFENKKGELVGGVVFHDWEPEAGVIEVSAASRDRRWVSSNTLRKLFSYPFDQLGCQAVVVRTAEDNIPVIRLWRAFGATEYTIQHLGGRNKGITVFILTDEAWAASKFMRSNHG